MCEEKDIQFKMSLRKHTTREFLNEWDALNWRHHKTGMLQAYLPNDGRRIHIWHRDLLEDGMTERGAMHDHRFSFVSDILVGSLTNTDLRFEEDPSGSSRVWEVCGASTGIVANWRKRELGNLHHFLTASHLAGQRYSMRKGEFHWARLEAWDPEMAITVIVPTTAKVRNARVIMPAGKAPRHAISKRVGRRHIHVAKNLLEMSL